MSLDHVAGLSDLILDPDDLVAVFALTSGRHGRWTEVFAERTATSTVRLSAGMVSEIRTDLDLGASVRASSALRDGFAYTNVLNRGSLLAAAEAAVVAAGGDPAAGNIAADLRRHRVVPVQSARLRPADVATVAKVEVLRRIDEAARSLSGDVRDVTATHVDVTQSVLIATSDGDVVSDERVRTRLTCRVTARRDGRLRTGFDGPGIGGGLELYDAEEPEAIGTRAAERALRALDGIEPPRGPMPVVLAPSGGGLLLHEACGHGLEAEGLARGSSIYTRSVGQQVASPLVTAVDDPSVVGGFGSYAVDDEGYPSARTVLVEGGVQTGALTTRTDQFPAGGRRSANGRRESYAHPPLTRMSNTFILPGSEPADGLVSSLRRGVYVVRLSGGDVDVTTGEFAFSASEAFLVDQGEVVAPLLSLTLLGNGPAALRSVEAVGDDLEFTQAVCGKGDQWVPVSYGSPTLLVSGLSVGGSGG
ncbi:MAG: TldD/PmbA family protein [Nocardioidaceae bacterium]